MIYHANDLLKISLNFANEIIGDSGNNNITRTNAKDDIYGLSGNDNINGGLEIDYIYGGDGNDSLTGGGENDFLLGGPGIDTAFLSGKSSDYQLGYSNYQFTITDNNPADGNDGIDSFNSIEQFIFSDKTIINFDTASKNSSEIFSNNGYYGTFADLAKAAYHLSINEDEEINCVKPYADDAWARVHLQMHILKGADLDMPFYGNDPNPLGWTIEEDGIFHKNNAAAFAARTGDSVFLSFRGTNDNDDGAIPTTDDMFDWAFMQSHYHELQPFIDKVDAYIKSNNITKVYVTGHSLGGGIALGYMLNHANKESVTANGSSISYEAVTFAAPKYPSVSSLNDDRIIAFEIDGDPVPDAGVGINPGQIVGLNIEGLPTNTYPVAGLVNPLLFVNWHSMDLYMAAVRMLDKELPNTAQKTTTIIHGFDKSLFKWADGIEAVFTAAEIFPTDSEWNLYTKNIAPQFLIANGNDHLSSSSNWGTTEYLIGGANDDYIIANNHANWLVGGSGFDWVSYETATSGVEVNLAVNGAQKTGGSGIDTLTSIEALKGSEFNDKFTGTLGNNIFYGQGGYDSVSYSNATSAVTVNLADLNLQNTHGAGSDILQSIEYIIGSNFGDILLGNNDKNIIDGGLGSDTMIGGDNSDTYYVRDTGDIINETNASSSGGTDFVYSYLSSYTLSTNVENGRIMSTGSANLSGNGHNNILYAGSGNNVLNGGSGTDAVSFYYGNNGKGVTVSLATSAAQATGGSGSDTLLGIENLYGTNFADKLTGNSGNNYLRGYDGNDTLDGGSGNDTMVGNAGNDDYYVRNAGDVVTEAASEGTDTVYSYLSSYTLGTNVENGRIMSTGSANLSGNGHNNILYAGTGNNVLNGGSGTDAVSFYYGNNGKGVTVSLATSAAQATGGSGSDTLLGIENLYGTNFADKLTGNSGNNVLNGGSGNDSLSGGDGNDSLIGGAGKDLLTGGAGKDIFVFNVLSEMGTTSSTWDVITDFKRGDDKIDLSSLDANSATGANDAFTGSLIAATANFTAAGQLQLKDGVLYGNIDADAQAEFAIALTSITTLSAADFVL